MNPVTRRKDETRQRIIAAAGRLFLRKGVDRVGVDEIMAECALTHGAFYSHFPSKEALISAACAAAIQETAEEWRSLVCNLGDEAFWEQFLAACPAGRPSCLDNPAFVLAMLGADVARRQATAQDSYIALVRALIDQIAEAAETERAKTILIVSALVGAASLAAQVAQDPALAGEILSATRNGLLKVGAGAAARREMS